jgi:hypothetical protein
MAQRSQNNSSRSRKEQVEEAGATAEADLVAWAMAAVAKGRVETGSEAVKVGVVGPVETLQEWLEDRPAAATAAEAAPEEEVNLETDTKEMAAVMVAESTVEVVTVEVKQVEVESLVGVALVVVE